MSKTRRRFTDEFKRETVRLCSQPGAVVTQVARNLDIDQSVLRRWVQMERGGAMEMNPAKPLRDEALSEVQRLQREMRQRHLSNRVYADHESLDKAVATAWLSLSDDVERIRRLTNFDWIRRAVSLAIQSPETS